MYKFRQQYLTKAMTKHLSAIIVKIARSYFRLPPILGFSLNLYLHVILSPYNLTDQLG